MPVTGLLLVSSLIYFMPLVNLYNPLKKSENIWLSHVLGSMERDQFHETGYTAFINEPLAIC